MEVHQLRYFIAVAEEGSFSRAAERVRVAQPSLSQQIQKLEAEAGQPLFDRLARGATLTEAGQELLPFARRILHDLTEAKRCLGASGKEPAGEVKIGIIPTIAPFIAQALLARCAEEFPALTIRIFEDVTDNLVRAVEGGEIDLAVMSTCRPMGGVSVRCVSSEPLLAAVAKNHPLARKKMITRGDLRSATVLVLHESHCLSHQIRRYCSESKITVEDDLSLMQLPTLFAFVAGRRGVSLVPQLARKQARDAGCVLVPFRRSPPMRQINLLRHGVRHQTKAASAAASVAATVIEELVPPV